MRPETAKRPPNSFHRRIPTPFSRSTSPSVQSLSAQQELQLHFRLPRKKSHQSTTTKIFAHLFSISQIIDEFSQKKFKLLLFALFVAIIAKQKKVEILNFFEKH